MLPAILCALTFRSFERTTPIRFKKLVTTTDEEPSEFLEARKEIFSLATTHSLPDIIGIGAAISEDNLAEHVGYFKGHLGGLPSRLAEIYSIYRLFTHEVSD